jgi:adenylate cyclase
MKKILLSPWTAIVTVVLIMSIRLVDPSFVESIRLRYFDQLITSKGTTVSQQVHVVNIDDETIRQKGQFPFPRGQYATLIADLYRNGAGLVVFNMYMPDGDRFGQDTVLAQTLKQYPVVLPQVATTDDIKNNYAPFRPGVSVIGGENAGVNFGNIDPNIKLFNETAAGIGVVNTLPEIDGVTRRIPMVVNSADKLFPSISLETLRVASGDPSFQVKVNDNGIEAVRIPQFGKITTDNLGRIWVDWSTKPIEHSASKLPKDFGGGIVIVGLTAKGLNNPVATATGAVYPHYVQASVLDTVISGTNISRPDWADGAEILAFAIASIFLLFLTRWVYAGLISLGLIAGGWIFASHFLFSSNLYLFDATLGVAGLILVGLHAYGVKFVSEFLQKMQIKKQFGTYLSPALVEKLQKNPELLTLGGESRELSIMFTDVRGFTTISEHYGEDVQGLTKIMNRYMTAMTAKIIENNGTLDKYIGDAQMAFWNAPLDEPNHAKMAVRTALQMMDSLDAFNDEITKEGIPAFGMGLGINTGTVVVGNMGSDQRFDYTCLGDSVNLASRLEGQSKPYGVRIVLGALTAEQVKDEYPVVELDCIAVKGKKQGVKIYTLAPPNELHDQWLDLYYRGQWMKAQFLIPQLKNVTPELAQYYDNMNERLQEGVPSNWDGTYRATSK